MPCRRSTKAAEVRTRWRGGVCALLLATFAYLGGATAARAAIPGLFYPVSGEISDTKVGSVLFYNYYTSNALNPSAHNTRIDLTNHSDAKAAFVRFIWVEGATGAPASFFLALAPNETVSLLASQIDPGITGYAVAVAIDAVSGCPTANNVLSGHAAIKFPKGVQFQGALNAVAVSALYTNELPGCDLNSVTAVLGFNGTIAGYNLLPRLLEADSIGSQPDNERGFLVVNRIGGNLITGASTLGDVDGTIFRDDAKDFPFTFNGGAQVQEILKKGFPTDKFKRAVPAGHTGWFELNPRSDFAVLGAVLFNSPGGGVNLRAQTLTLNASITVPVEPPSF